MSLSVSSELHYCPVGESFVFLSLRTDRYSLLEGSASDRFRRFLGGTADARDVEWLAERHIIAEGELPRDRRAETIIAPRSSVIDAPLPPVGLGAVFTAIRAQRQARRDVTRSSLAEIFAEFADPSCPKASGEQVSLRIASAFERARRYVSAIDQCLVRGIAMRRMLLRHDRKARLVIGVAMPFSAHCWVQVGDVVLTDSLELIRSFQPMLAV